MNFLKRIWLKLMIQIKFPKEDGIVFIHKSPRVFNIGDYLCSPRHYIKFYKPINDLIIIGGGAFPNFAIDFINKNYINIHKSILWAVGNSEKKFTYQVEKVSSLPYLQWGVRDIDSVSLEHFLPCVSCLHPMLDEKIVDSGTLLFLNKNSKVSSSEYIQFYKNLAKKRNWNILFNNCSEKDIIDALKKNTHIITNSYHGAYWGLLSGQ